MKPELKEKNKEQGFFLFFTCSEKTIGKRLGRMIKSSFVLNQKNPDKIIKYAIQEIYGHNVELGDLVNVIEDSPLHSPKMRRTKNGNKRKRKL